MLKRMLLLLVLVCPFVGCEEQYYDERPETSSEVADWDVGKKLLVFTIPGCEPCRRDRPVVDEIRDQGYDQGLGVVVIDAHEYPEMAEEFGVKRYPTYVVCEDGEVRAISDSIKTVLKVLKFLFKIAIFLVML